MGDIEAGGQGEVAEPEGGKVKDEDEDGQGDKSGAGALQIGGAEGDMAADAKEEVEAEIEAPVMVKSGVVDLLKKSEEGLPELTAETELAAPGDKVGRHHLHGAQRSPEFSAEKGERDQDDQRRPEPDRPGADEEIADILIKIFLVPAVLDITEDAVLARAKEGDVADGVAEKDAEERVAEFVDHGPRCGQPDVNLFAHERGGANANRRREKVHRRSDKQDRAEEEQ